MSRLCFYRLKCVSHLQSVFLEVQLIVDWYLQYPKCASFGWAAFHSQSVFLLVQLVPKCPELCSYCLCCGPYSVCVPNDAADYDSIRFDSMSRLCSYWLSLVPYHSLCSYWSDWYLECQETVFLLVELCSYWPSWLLIGTFSAQAVLLLVELCSVFAQYTFHKLFWISA